MKKIFNSLMLFFGLSLLISAFYYQTYDSSKTSLLKRTKENLEDLNNLMIMNLNGDELSQLIQSGKDDDENYRKVISKLSLGHEQIKKQIKYVYTVHKIENGYQFGLDTAPRLDQDGDGKIDHAFLRQEYTDIPDAAKLSFETRKIELSDSPYTDQWGTFVSSFNPIYNSKKEIVGVLGMDIDLHNYLNDSMKLKSDFLISLFLIELIIGALSIFSYYFQKKVDREKQIEEESRSRERTLAQVGKLAEIGMLTASISHEINTPLSIIGLQSQRLKSASSLEKVHGISDKIMEALQRVVETITTMKNFIRAEPEQMQLVPIENILKDVITLISGLVKIVDFSIYNKSKATIQCYPNQIAQVLINLINNSLDAIKNREEKWIQLKLYDLNNYLHIEVSDSGEGIPEEVYKKIELGYFSTKEKNEGSGMGLMISRKIIENHTGSFRYTREAKNTTFSIQIPIKESIPNRIEQNIEKFKGG